MDVWNTPALNDFCGIMSFLNYSKRYFLVYVCVNILNQSKDR